MPTSFSCLWRESSPIQKKVHGDLKTISWCEGSIVRIRSGRTPSRATWWPPHVQAGHTHTIRACCPPLCAFHAAHTANKRSV